MILMKRLTATVLFWSPLGVGNTFLLGVNRTLTDDEYRAWVIRQIRDPFASKCGSKRTLKFRFSPVYRIRLYLTHLLV